MQERFTDRADKVLFHANRAAVDSPEVTTDHLLAGLIREGAGVAAHTLKNAGATDLIGGAYRFSNSDPKPFSADLQAVLERAPHVATEFEHSRVGTEHLLYALLETPGPGLQRLIDLKFKPSAFQHLIKMILGFDVNTDEDYDQHWVTITAILKEDKPHRETVKEVLAYLKQNINGS